MERKRLFFEYLLRASGCDCRPCCTMQVEVEDNVADPRNSGLLTGSSSSGAALAACEALLSLACLAEAKLAIVRQHPRVRRALRQGIGHWQGYIDTCCAM